MKNSRFSRVLWTITIFIGAYFSASPMVYRSEHYAHRNVASLASSDQLEIEYLANQRLMGKIYSNASIDRLNPYSSPYRRTQMALLQGDLRESVPLISSRWGGQMLGDDMVGIGLGIDPDFMQATLMREMQLSDYEVMANRSSFGLNYASQFGFGGLGNNSIFNTGGFSTLGDSLPIGYTAIGTPGNVQAWGSADTTIGARAAQTRQTANTRATAALSSAKTPKIHFESGASRSGL